MSNIIQILKKDDIREIFLRNNIKRAYLTGSFARGEENNTSDIDLIFEKKTGTPFSLMNIGDLKYSLETKLNRSVDLVSSTAIRPCFREDLERDKIRIF